MPVAPNTLFVLPVLVVQDPMLRTPFINYFLNQRFLSERARFPSIAKVHVLPLNVVHITELEDLVEMAEAFDLDVLNVLHRRCNTNGEMLWELADVVRSIPDNGNLVSPRFQEVLEKSNDEMCSILFKGFEATNMDAPKPAAADGQTYPPTS